ncbi:hypothetical protein D9758_012265 [Tetrapyrgos nigripes]|uniref:DUF4604 domain-containing protein n=1 Tax=Tetrapyrgos nigripes TaxID=182062 RepID=A0A8H5FLU8_9AGAR|nr:hypothetical protein D9758_012265 [Tetrapyrgos nigripes]
MSKRARSPTRAQLSSKLAYEKKVPAFLRKLQSQYGGGSNYNDEDEDEPQYEGVNNREEEDEGGLDEFGREIRRPRRSPEPELDEFGREIRRRGGEGESPRAGRPPDNAGSADEDEYFEDEKPQVVVLKEGKHLTEREAENVRRKEKGLPPLSDPSNPSSSSQPQTQSQNNKPTESSSKGLSFSSSTSTSSSSATSNPDLQKTSRNVCWKLKQRWV